jgi:hypothetical protein
MFKIVIGVALSFSIAAHLFEIPKAIKQSEVANG